MHNTKIKESKSAGFRSAFVASVMLVALLRSAAANAIRPPRVYNALITSDQQLLPSQADPIVQPVLRPFRYFYDWPAVHYASVPVQAVPSESPRADDAHAAAPADSAPEEPNAAATAAVEERGPLARPPAAGVFMNNKPAGSAVPDVPPPPLPSAGAGKKDKKKAEEYPPAPVGFAI